MSGVHEPALGWERAAQGWGLEERVNQNLVSMKIA